PLPIHDTFHSSRHPTTYTLSLHDALPISRNELHEVHEPYAKAALEHFVRELESHSSLGHYQDMNVLGAGPGDDEPLQAGMVFAIDRKSTRLNSSHVKISYAVFCLKKKKNA